MATVRARVEIQGIRPLMFHVFGSDALSLERKEKTGVAGNDPEEWRKTYTATREGQLYLRPDYVFSAIVGGAKNVKLGRGSVMSKMQATLQVEDEILLLDRWMPEEITTDPLEDVYLDVRSVRNPATKGRNVRYRVTCSPGWRTTFHVSFDNTVVSKTAFEDALTCAGQLAGLGDGRSIGMGRFEVVSLDYL